MEIEEEIFGEELLNSFKKTSSKNGNISPDFIGDNPEEMEEGTICPLEENKNKYFSMYCLNCKKRTTHVGLEEKE